ncbi:sodium-coupled monocarboxylate transporter 2 [Ixodes scapularis]
MRYGKYTALTACAIYFILMGGLRGVVWTDSLQAVISFLAPVTIIIKVIYDAHKESVKLEPLEKWDTRPYFLDISLDFTKDENVWACLVGLLGVHIYVMGLEQMTVQRYAAARSLKDAKRVALTAALVTSVFHLLRAITAFALIYWYRNCDPLTTGDIVTVDQVLPFYVSRHLIEFPGFCGIFLAGVVSACTSTVSSMINSCAAVCYVDIVSPRFPMTDHRATQVTRGMAFAIGIIMTSYSAAVGYLGSTTKGAGTATLLMVTFQMWHMSQKLLHGAPPPRMPVTVNYCPGNITGLSGYVNNTLLTDDHGSSSGFFLSQMSSYWSSLISVILTIAIGLVISLLTGGRSTYKQHLHLSSEVFLRLWRKVGFIPSEEDIPMACNNYQ